MRAGPCPSSVPSFVGRAPRQVSRGVPPTDRGTGSSNCPVPETARDAARKAAAGRQVGRGRIGPARGWRAASIRQAGRCRRPQPAHSLSARLFGAPRRGGGGWGRPGSRRRRPQRHITHRTYVSSTMCHRQPTCPVDHSGRRLGGPRASASHSDDDFGSGVSHFQIAQGFRGLGQRVRSVDDRPDLPGFDQLLQSQEVLLPARPQEKWDLLTPEA